MEDNTHTSEQNKQNLFYVWFLLKKKTKYNNTEQKHSKEQPARQSAGRKSVDIVRCHRISSKPRPLRR